MPPVQVDYGAKTTAESADEPMVMSLMGIHPSELARKLYLSCRGVFCLAVILSPVSVYGQSVAADHALLAQDFASIAENGDSASRDEILEEGQIEEQRKVNTDPMRPANRGAESGPAWRLLIGSKLGLAAATFGGPDANRSFPDGDVIESTYKLGFAVNVFGKLLITDNWGVATEVSYATRGAGAKYNGEDRPPFDFSYLETIVLGTFQVPLAALSERLSFHIVLGPSLSYLLYAGIDGTEFDDVKTIELGVHGGFGASVELPFGNPLIEIRYYHGFLDPFERTGLDESHRALTFFIGYEVALPLF